MRFYGVDVTDMNRTQIDNLFLANDESHLWPVENKFNATQKAIETLKAKERDGLELPDGGPEYAAALDQEISDIVNSII